VCPESNEDFYTSFLIYCVTSGVTVKFKYKNYYNAKLAKIIALDLETVFWGYIPVFIAVIEIFFSIYITRKGFSYLHLMISGLILILNGFALYALVEMLNGSWPSYMPHVGIGISTMLILIQWETDKKRN